MQQHETEELKKFIQQTMQEEIKKALDPITKKLDPMYVVFSQAKGFNAVAVWLLKTIVVIGAGITVILALLKWLRS